MVLTDPLTGLYNKRYLERHLGGLIESGKGRHLALLMVDVDHFKCGERRVWPCRRRPRAAADRRLAAAQYAGV